MAGIVSSPANWAVHVRRVSFASQMRLRLQKAASTVMLQIRFFFISRADIKGRFPLSPAKYSTPTYSLGPWLCTSSAFTYLASDVYYSLRYLDRQSSSP